MTATEQARTLMHELVAPFEPAGMAPEWIERGIRVRADARAAIFDKGLGDATTADGTTPRVEWGEVIEMGSAYRIRKLRYEAIAGYWVPALLYEPTAAPLPPGGRAAVLNADGHHDAGNAAEAKQIRSVNLALRGVVVLSYEFVGMGELAGDADLDPALGASLHDNLATHELVGIGAPALMYACMRNALEMLLAHPDVDPERVVMTGLSGGGWQTIVLAALDDRIAGAVPVAGYTSIGARIDCPADVGDLEQVPADMARIADYQLLTALLAPRPALLVYNELDDCCFVAERVKPVVFDAVKPVYETFGRADAFTFHRSEVPGDHNYGPDNRAQLYAFLDRHFGVDGPPGDVHRADDLLSEQQLRVGLPVEQRTVRDVARERARVLRGVRRGRGHDAATVRSRVREVLRVHEVTAQRRADPADPRSGRGTLRVPPFVLPTRWVVPEPGDTAVTLIIDDVYPSVDGGDPLRAAWAVELLGTASMALDRSSTAMLSCVGVPLLGIMVSQLLATARLMGSTGAGVDVAAGGLVVSAAALLAAALEPECFASVTATRGALSSLEELVERGVRYAEAAALFCPDLLTVIDLADAVALLGDVRWDASSRSGTSYPR